MNPSTSTTLRFRLDDGEAASKLVVVLSAVFHVVPSVVEEGREHLLSVEVDAEHPWLLDDVRQLVLEGDPRAQELPDRDRAAQDA